MENLDFGVGERALLEALVMMIEIKKNRNDNDNDYDDYDDHDDIKRGRHQARHSTHGLIG